MNIVFSFCLNNFYDKFPLIRILSSRIWIFFSLYLLTYFCCAIQSLKLCLTLWPPWTATCQASLSSTISQSLLRLMSIESVMLSDHLMLCHPLLLLPSAFPSIRIFSSETTLHIRWPKYWSFSFSISPPSEYSGFISLRLTGLISLQSKGLSRKSL